MHDFHIPVVVLHDNDQRGIVVSYGAYTSTVVYEEHGHKYRVQVPNEDFTIIDHINFMYEEQ